MMAVRPAFRVMEARSWTQTPCRIVSSHVGTHPGSKGTTYSIDIVFSYRVAGRQFTGRQYDFMGGSSSGSAGKQAIVEQYPRGRQTVCYVNPSNPAEAVIYRGFPHDMAFGLIPLAFLAAGSAGLAATRKGTNPGNTGKLWAPAVMPASGVTVWGGTVKRPAGDIGLVSADPSELRHEGAVEMKPVTTPVRNLVNGLIFATLFTGGFILLLEYQAPEWKAHGVDWGMAALVGIVGLLALMMVFGTIQAFMRLFDPRIRVRLTPGTLRLGKDFAVAWELEGGRKRLSQLRITLESREEADYPGDKSTHTASSVCYRADLVNTQDAAELAAGTVTLKVPGGVMHSLNTGRNRIAWKMRVEGKVPRWPGIRDEYPVVVLPEGWEGERA